MNVLIACEFSGIVREAFKKKGHNAWSCDLEPSEIEGNHYQIPIEKVLDLGVSWDLMIAHPPCTYLTVAANRWYSNKPWLIQEAKDFVLFLATAPIDKIAIENPVGRLSTLWRKPDQIIQPWWFGDDASKKTCLWLKNLPLLKETNKLPGDNKTRRANQTPSEQNKLGPSPTRWKDRSRTYQGIANAMAEQWGVIF